MKKRPMTRTEITERKLKAARAKAAMTQEDVAEVMGVTKSAISRWEKDIDNVNFGDVLKLCRILDIDISDLAS